MTTDSNKPDKQEATKKTNWAVRSIQDWLSLGYIYLLGLGIAKDAIYYGYFNINILNYASILDVVLSPINLLIERKIIIGLIALIILVISLVPFLHKKWREKAWYKKRFDVPTLDKRYEAPLVVLVAPLAALMLFSAYIGYGVGAGGKMSDRVYTGKFKTNYSITFNNEKQLNVRMIGQNSQYLFYAAEGDKHVTITPIQSNVKKIEPLKNQ